MLLDRLDERWDEHWGEPVQALRRLVDEIRSGRVEQVSTPPICINKTSSEFSMQLIDYMGDPNSRWLNRINKMYFDTNSRREIARTRIR